MQDILCPNLFFYIFCNIPTKRKEDIKGNMNHGPKGNNNIFRTPFRLWIILLLQRNLLRETHSGPRYMKLKKSYYFPWSRLILAVKKVSLFIFVHFRLSLSFYYQVSPKVEILFLSLWHYRNLTDSQSLWIHGLLTSLQGYNLAFIPLVQRKSENENEKVIIW